MCSSCHLHLFPSNVSLISLDSLLTLCSLFQWWNLYWPARQEEEVPEQEKEPNHRLVSAQELPLQKVQTGQSYNINTPLLSVKSKTEFSCCCLPSRSILSCSLPAAVVILNSSAWNYSFDWFCFQLNSVENLLNNILPPTSLNWRWSWPPDEDRVFGFLVMSWWRPKWC